MGLLDELQETYYDNGRGKRPFRVDPKTGVEYLYIADKREKVIIRTALPEDAKSICRSMKPVMQAIARKKHKSLEEVIEEQTEKIRKTIEDYDPCDPNMSFVFEKKTNKPKKFIGFGETSVNDEDPTFAKINMTFISQDTRDTYKRRLCRALTNACEKYGLYDGLLLVDFFKQGSEEVLY